jgi:tetratricopeptide (TPR) repeat protein
MDSAEFTDWAASLFDAYLESRDAGDLRAAVSLARDAAVGVPAGHPERTACFNGLRQVLEALFEGTDDTSVLFEAVQAARDTVRAGAADGADLSDLRYRLANLLFPLHQRTGDTAVLDEAIRETRAGIDAAGDDYTRAVHLNHLGGYLYQLFLITGDLPTLRDADQVIRQVLALVPAERPERPMLLDNHRRVLVKLFNRTGDTAKLAEAVASAHESVMTELTGEAGRATSLAVVLPAVLGRQGDGTALAEMIELADGPAGQDADDDDAYLGQALFLAGVALKVTKWADESNDTALLRQALEASRDAVSAIPAGHPHRGLALNDVGLAASFLGDQTGDLALFAEWVQAARERVSIAVDDPDRAEALDSLGEALRKSAERTGDTGMLEEAVRTARAAVDLAPPGADRTRYADSLRKALSTLGERTGDAAVLGEAVRVARETASLAGPGDPDQAEYLANLSSALRQLSERTPDAAGVLAEAVHAARRAVAAAPADDRYHGYYLNRLGAALLASYERGGSDLDLAESVRSHRAAVAATPPGDIDRAGYLSGLGFALRVLLERSGDAGLLAEAVQVAGDAVAATPPGHPSLAARLTNLGTALQARYERTGEIAVLTQAVEAARGAAAATPPGHTERSGYLSNLANGLRLLFQRTGDEQALAEAERTARDAVAAAGQPDSDRATYLGNLGTVLYIRYGHTGNVGALTEAARVTADAVAAAGPGSARRASCLSVLADCLRTLSDETHDPALLAEAARAAEEAVAATPADQPDRTSHLMNLGYVLATRARATGDHATMARARDCFAEAARNTAAPVPHRIRGYREAARVTAAAGGTSREALGQLEAAVALLPLAATRTLARVDQEHAVANLASLSGEVAAAAVAAGRPDRAVELLEQTRGIMVADTLDALSSDVSRLREDSPALAAEFADLRGRVDALNRADGLGGSTDSVRQRQDTYAAWDGLVARIRGVSGFEDFLRSPDIRVLSSQAAAGPVIFPYTSQAGCGALILGGNLRAPVTAVPLDVTEQDVFRHAATLADALEAGAQDVIRSVLAWMWDAVTGPVLTALGHTAGPDGRPWPRVWWCPTGIFAHLPLHAAGHHDHGQRSVMDLVVSSYATTVRGMAYSRALRSAATARRALVVVASDVPGTSRLPGANRESQVLARFIPTVTTLWHPTRDAVMAALPASQVVHFACHGYADIANPRASQLVLYDHGTSPLTVADIGSLRLASELAYLSACDSAVTSRDLADEAVHLAGAFHLAGYQNVIGTLWPVGDRSAGMIAEDFYRQLTSGGTRPPDTSRASFALHSATRRLRDRFPGHPAHWAGYIHTGN